MWALAMTRKSKEPRPVSPRSGLRSNDPKEQRTTAGESRVYTGRGLSISHLVRQVRIFWRTVRIYRAAKACLYSSVLRASPGPLTTDQRKMPALSITKVPRIEKPLGSKNDP